jgi:uncharacterized protein (DUF1800 family)
MALSRREFVKLAGLVSAGAGLAACAPVYEQIAQLDSAPFSISPTALATGNFGFLNRLTFGAVQPDLLRADEIGLAGWIEEQLDPELLDDGEINWRLRKFETLEKSADALEGWEKEDVVAELKQATLLRQVYSRRQLYETMVEFWTDHFNISAEKGMCWALKVVDDREVIREHALGKFRDLLWASAHSPAMLVYLDNQANQKGAPNENYAREVMELHSLGVHGGYTQDDVIELARCLTGWTVKKHFWPGEFTFDEDVHDWGEKWVLNQAIQPQGLGEAEEVMEMLAAHPATAHHIAVKLVRKFICDDPEQNAPELVDQAASTFLKTEGDIKAVLRTILLDGLISRPELLQPKYKRPVKFITSALRMLGAQSTAHQALDQKLSLMGQPQYEWPTPDGPPDYAGAWNANLLPRWKFALELVTGEIPGTKLDYAAIGQSLEADPDVGVLDTLSLAVIGAKYPEEGKPAILELLDANLTPQEALRAIIAGLVASPAFQWH